MNMVNNMKTATIAAFFLAAGVIFSPHPANSQAENKAENKAGSQEEEKNRPFTLQLIPFNVPIIWPGGRRGNTIIVIYFSLPAREDVEKACLLMPRLRDTVIDNLLRFPMKVSGGSINMDGIPERLQTAANEKLGDNQVIGVRMTYGIGLRKMEGSKICKEFLKEFKKKKSSEKKE